MVAGDSDDAGKVQATQPPVRQATRQVALTAAGGGCSWSGARQILAHTDRAAAAGAR
jgi:hypothetical protein